MHTMFCAQRATTALVAPLLIAASPLAPLAGSLAVMKPTTNARKTVHHYGIRYTPHTPSTAWSSRNDSRNRNTSTGSSCGPRTGALHQRRRRRGGEELSTDAQRGASCDEKAVLPETASRTSGEEDFALLREEVEGGAVTAGGGLIPEVLGREVLTREAWMARAEDHRARVRALTGGSVHHDHTDPILNFLFEYYHFKPRLLLQWTPGFDVHLLEADPSKKGSPLPEKAWEPGPGGGGHYNPFGLNANRRNTVRRVRDFLEVTSARVPVFHCYGLHEWAMLYHPAGAEEDARNLHQTLPLRVSQEEINAMVEGKGGDMCCTHFDAFRFFTPEAKPLNHVVLSRADQKSSDQPGCVHANMDLFKWALRLWPLLPSEDMTDALELAVSCRMLDMRASPYDLAAHGKVSKGPAATGKGREIDQSRMEGLSPETWNLSPVEIETERGRKEYQRAQWDLYRRSMPIRRSLLRHMDRLLEIWGV